MISTDKQQIQELLTRGVEQIYPSSDFLEKQLTSGEQLTIYTGYDPTGPSLHIGHGITMIKLRQLQQLGHKIIMLIGDFTAMIGDPTDKSAARSQLTREQVLDNCKAYQDQAAAILDFDGDNAVEVRYNNDWLGKMSFSDVLELASHFTVQQMIQRDMFQRRMDNEKAIYIHEFMYPMMQGYDSVVMDVDGEVGGNDQTFNMLTGRDLLKEMKQKEKFVIAMKLLADESGKKMGKSEGNMIALSDSAEDMFGKVMSWTDGMIMPGFELCTTLPMEEVASIQRALDDGENPRNLKLRLAGEITKLFLGEEAAEQGMLHFEKVIQSGGVPDDMPELSPTDNDIVAVLVEAELVKSNSEARRAIDQGGVRINDEKVDSYEADVASGDIIQKGKRHFVKIV